MSEGRIGASEYQHLSLEQIGAVANMTVRYGEPVSTIACKTQDKIDELWDRVLKNDAAAMVTLGALYVDGSHGILKQNYRLAYVLFNDASEREEPNSYIYLLFMASGAKKNASSKAVVAALVEKIKNAASKNIPGALFALGILHVEKICPSISQDVDATVKLWMKAGQLGCRLAMPFVGNYLGSPEEQEEWYCKALSLGHTRAYLDLAKDFFGKHDIAKYIEYLQKGAELGDRASRIKLAYEYYKGEYLPKDVEKAKELLEECSAEGGDGYSMEVLGDIYAAKRMGQTALSWYEKAFQAGAEEPPKLAEKIAHLLITGLEDLPANTKQAVLWLSKGSELGSLSAMKNISTLLKTGRMDLAKDSREAMKWEMLCKKPYQ